MFCTIFVYILYSFCTFCLVSALKFNIYLNDLFFALKDIEVCSFVDDTTPFVCDLDLNTFLNNLEENSAITLTWFERNYMKLNSDKCHLLFSGHHYEEMFINIGNNRIWESKNADLLEITVDQDLKFYKHVNKICSKANRKINVLPRMQSFLSAGKRRIIFTSFTRAFSSSLLRAIIAHNYLSFFKIFSSFTHFCPKFQIFCPFTCFCPFPPLF